MEEKPTISSIPSLEPSDEQYVVLRNINKFYDKSVHAVTDFNLTIHKHEFIVFVGPSGCGKSTTLRMVAGLEDISSGELFINGTYCNDLPPSERDIAMVFQSYALYPNMTVYDNMAFSLKVKNVDKEEIDRRVHAAAKILEIESYLDRKPKALSGGQRQRVALGRAIVRNARLFLMDEPLSNLDAKLRVQMRSEIIKLHERLEATTIYVTHDQTEAMTMADRIVCMKDGFVQQIATPMEIYRHPANKFVASFIGSPAMNFAEGTYAEGKVTFPNGFEVPLTKEQIEKHDAFYRDILAQEAAGYAAFVEAVKEKRLSALSKRKKKDFVFDPDADEEIIAKKKAIELYRSIVEKNAPHPIIFGIRPEHIGIVEKGDLDIVVDLSELLGDQYYLHFDFAGKDFLSKVTTEDLIAKGEKLSLSFRLDKAHLFDTVSEKAIY